MSVSGLGRSHRRVARRRVLQAAYLGLHHSASIHYTQGGARWQGIADHRLAKHGRYPNYADCSAFATWCLWNGLKVTFNVRDVVNGARWQAGYTGTMLNHGKRVRGARKVGDCVIYGNGFPGEHVAIYVGGGRVISHGSEAGPFLLPVHYR